MGLDVGDKTIGVAISDLLQITAQGLITIKRESYEKDFNRLEAIIKEYNIKKIVVGLPKNMNNTIGPQGEKVIKFTEKLKARFKKVEIIYEDERLTTSAAERLLIEGDMRREKRKTVIDKVAATFILQTYLDRKGREDNER